MKKVRSVKVWTDGFNAVNQKVEDFVVLFEFFEAKEATEEEVDKTYKETIEAVEKLEDKNMLRS
jgi:peptide chain release factor 2